MSLKNGTQAYIPGPQKAGLKGFWALINMCKIMSAHVYGIYVYLCACQCIYVYLYLWQGLFIQHLNGFCEQSARTCLMAT